MPKNLFKYILLLISFISSAVTEAQPTANFSVTPTSGCNPLIIQLTDLSTGNPTSWEWTISGPTTTILHLQNPATTLTVPGTYSVTLKASNNAGFNTLTRQSYITVYDTPTVNFIATPTIVCPGGTVQFTDQSTLRGSSGTYQWLLGNGNPNTSTAKNPSAIYNTGPNTITLSVTNNHGCISTLTKPAYVDVYAKPTASFTASPVNFCENNTTPPFTSTFNGSATGGTTPYTYNWDFGFSGTGGTGTGQTYTTNFAGPAPKSYTIKLTVTDVNGCTDLVELPNYINISRITPAISGPSSACAGIPFTFTNNSGSSTNATWTITPNIMSNVPSSPSIGATIHTAGNYKVLLTANNTFGCSDTISRTIKINPQPNINFTYTPAQPCPAPQTLTFTGTGASTYEWDFGSSPNSGTGTVASHTYLDNLDYFATVIGTDANGCKDTITKDVRIYDIKFNAQPDSFVVDIYKTAEICAPQRVPFSVTLKTRTGVQDYPYKVGTVYTWDFGEFPNAPTVTTTKDTISYKYTTHGTFKVIVTAVTGNGCVVRDTAYVKSGPKPHADFVASPIPQCAGQEVVFTSTSTNTISNTTYVWYPMDSLYKNYDGPVHTFRYDTSGTFTAWLIVNNNGCRDTIIKLDTIYIKPPHARYKINYDCTNPLKATFVNLSDSATSFRWDFLYPNTTPSSTQASTSYIYPALGTYTFRFIARNDTNGCSDTLIRSLQLYDPIVAFKLGRTQICKDDSTMLTQLVTGGSIDTFKWYIDNSLTHVYPAFNSSAPDYWQNFSTKGYRKVKLWIRDSHGCEDSSVVNNALLVSQPTPSFTASPTSGCASLPVVFTDQSSAVTNTTITNRQWDFGNGNGASYSNTTTVPYTYPLRGSYTVKLVLTDNIGCKDSLTRNNYISVYKPVASYFTSTPNSCIGKNVNFVNTSTNAVTSQWDFGDGASSTDANPVHKYNAVGQYNVRLIVTDAQGCKDTLLKPNYIVITKPIASFTVSDSFKVCPPLIVDFTNTSSNIDSFTIIAGTGNIFRRKYTSPNQMVREAYVFPGYDTAYFIVKDVYGCSDTAIVHIDVLGYNGIMSYTPLKGCQPLKVDFTARLNNTTQIAWDFNDGVVKVGNGLTSISHIYDRPGSYLPKIIITGGGCAAASLGLDTIKVDAAVAEFSTSPLCIGQTVRFEDKSWGYFSSISARNWEFDNNRKSFSTTPSIYYGSSGDFPVKLMVINKNGCADTLDTVIHINELPLINAGKDTTICLKDTTHLSASGGISYIWSPAASLSCTNCPDPLANPAIRTKYTVIGTDANKCSDTDEVEISIKTKVTAIAGEGGDICIDEKIPLSVKGAKEYLWIPSQGLDNDRSPNPVASPRQTTNYIVVSYEGSCIPDTDGVKVIVYPKPTVRASGTQTIIAGNTATIMAEGSLIQKFQWAPAESLSCSDCADPRATPARTTEYTITVFSEHNCIDSDHVTITVLCDESQVFIPNTFTPNNDGMNDVFYPRGNGIDRVKSLTIFNRWGEIVYQRNEFPINDATQGWDGTYKGEKLPPDVFVYLVEAYCSNGEIYKWKGDVTIIR